LNPNGLFSTERQNEHDRPVYQIEIGPEDGYYPLPCMVRQTDGGPWEGDGTSPTTARQHSRQPFMPDGTRTFEEIDRLGIGPQGVGNMISRKADVDFYRIAPSGGYMKGLAKNGQEAIAPEVSGKNFFPYGPFHLSMSPPRMTLARITNMTQKILGSGRYDGAIWTRAARASKKPCTGSISQWM
jgi:hypothetical protein